MEQSDWSRDPGCIAVACGMVVVSSGLLLHAGVLYYSATHTSCDLAAYTTPCGPLPHSDVLVAHRKAEANWKEKGNTEDCRRIV